MARGKDDDADDGDDDDDGGGNSSSSGSGSDAVIQYGSLHTCQNKRTDARADVCSEIRNTSLPISSAAADPPTPARADAARRVRHVESLSPRHECANDVRQAKERERERRRKKRGEERWLEAAHDTYAVSARHRLALLALSAARRARRAQGAGRQVGEVSETSVALNRDGRPSGARRPLPLFTSTFCIDTLSFKYFAPCLHI